MLGSVLVLRREQKSGRFLSRNSLFSGEDSQHGVLHGGDLLSAFKMSNRWFEWQDMFFKCIFQLQLTHNVVLVSCVQHSD